MEQVTTLFGPDMTHLLEYYHGYSLIEYFQPESRGEDGGRVIRMLDFGVRVPRILV